MGYVDSYNLYAYVGNNPINAVDPDGRFLNLVIGAAVNVGIGYGMSVITGEEYSWKDATIDAIAGATGAGLLSKLGKLATLGKVVTAIGGDVGLGVAQDYGHYAVSDKKNADGSAKSFNLGESTLYNSLGVGISGVLGNVIAPGLKKLLNKGSSTNPVVGNQGGYTNNWISKLFKNNFDPKKIKFSQETVSNDVNSYIQKMKTGSWFDLQDASFNPDSLSIDIVKTPNGYLTIDNRRLYAAKVTDNLDKFTFNIYNYTDQVSGPRSEKFIGTWGDFILNNRDFGLTGSNDFPRIRDLGESR